MMNDMVYECLDCGKEEVVKWNDYKIDGRRCKYCGGHLSPIGYVLVGIDMATSVDMTGYSPLKNIV